MVPANGIPAKPLHLFGWGILKKELPLVNAHAGVLSANGVALKHTLLEMQVGDSAHF